MPNRINEKYVNQLKKKKNSFPSLIYHKIIIILNTLEKQKKRRNRNTTTTQIMRLLTGVVCGACVFFKKILHHPYLYGLYGVCRS